jgi:hypothetical protein
MVHIFCITGDTNNLFYISIITKNHLFTPPNIDNIINNENIFNEENLWFKP